MRRPSSSDSDQGAKGKTLTESGGKGRMGGRMDGGGGMDGRSDALRSFRGVSEDKTEKNNRKDEWRRGGDVICRTAEKRTLRYFFCLLFQPILRGQMIESFRRKIFFPSHGRRDSGGGIDDPFWERMDVREEGRMEEGAAGKSGKEGKPHNLGRKIRVFGRSPHRYSVMSQEEPVSMQLDSRA